MFSEQVKGIENVSFQIARVNVAHKKIQQREENKEHFTLKAAHKLASIYKEAIDALLKEQDIYQSILDEIQKKRKRTSVDTPNKKNKIEEQVFFSNGQQVAAKTTSEWIIATVIGYVKEKEKYQVEDVDDGELGTRKRYLLSPKMLLPIPSNDNLVIYPSKHTVLALYPASTCFYKATVVMPPSPTSNTYIVQFEDDNGFERTVEKRMVLELPPDM